MARAEVIHSQDGCTIMFRGDPKRPEPSTGVIRFPGGYVEVSRCSNGDYWAHVHTFTNGAPDEESPAGRVVESRLTHTHEHAAEGIPPLPAADRIQTIAVRIARQPE